MRQLSEIVFKKSGKALSEQLQSIPAGAECLAIIQFVPAEEDIFSVSPDEVDRKRVIEYRREYKTRLYSDSFEKLRSLQLVPADAQMPLLVPMVVVRGKVENLLAALEMDCVKAAMSTDCQVELVR